MYAHKPPMLGGGLSWLGCGKGWGGPGNRLWEWWVSKRWFFFFFFPPLASLNDCGFEISNGFLFLCGLLVEFEVSLEMQRLLLPWRFYSFSLNTNECVSLSPTINLGVGACIM